MQDLDAGAEFIARDSPRYAASFVRRVREAARSLSRMSQRGRRVPEVDDPRVRELFVSRYRLIYEIAGSDVSILTLIHGAQDLTTLWEEWGPRGTDPEDS